MNRADGEEIYTEERYEFEAKEDKTLKAISRSCFLASFERFYVA